MYLLDYKRELRIRERDAYFELEAVKFLLNKYSTNTKK